MPSSGIDGWGFEPDVDAATAPEGPLPELAAWLAGRAARMGGWEARWLLGLARFDELAGWLGDGALSCVDWLEAHAGMARPTGYEKLRVARQLACRPVLAEAFATGRIAYSAVRLIARAVGALPATDAALVELAVTGSLRRVENAVLAYLHLRDQDRPPSERRHVRGIRRSRLADGMVRVDAVVTEAESEEVFARLHAIADAELEDEEEAAKAAAANYAAAYSCQGDVTGLGGAPEAPRGWAERMVDAFMAMCRGEAGTVAERYLVHVVEQHGRLTLIGGGPLTAGEEGVVTCDAPRVLHEVVGDEPLRLGRRRRVWNTSQRRAILVRDDGHCRFPGCGHRMVDVHHIVPWEDGGSTDVENGLLLCRRHHQLMHGGWTVTGDVHRGITFHRPAA